MREMTDVQVQAAKKFVATLVDGKVTLKLLNAFRDSEKIGVTYILGRCTKQAKGVWLAEPLMSLVGPVKAKKVKKQKAPKLTAKTLEKIESDMTKLLGERVESGEVPTIEVSDEDHGDAMTELPDFIPTPSFQEERVDA